MPEGDTIHQLAALLRPELEGARLRRVRLRGQQESSVSPCHVREVFARGKHLFIELDDGLQLRSHLGMNGTWHRYRHGERWRRPAGRAWLVLELDHTVLVCFDAKEVELLPKSSLRARQLQAGLGPDLALAEVSFEAIVSRARAMLASETLAADLLLDQRVACGIGNVYKSEVLFLKSVHPRASVAELDDDTVVQLYRTAHDLLRRNLSGGPRVTRFLSDGRGDLWVYRRAGRPCLRCGATVVSARYGQTWRSTYLCEACQPVPVSPG